MGNPFLDDFPELVMLDNRNCADESVKLFLCTLEETGKQQYQDFLANMLVNCTTSIHNPIKRNSLTLFKRPQIKATSKQGKKIKLLQNNVAFNSTLPCKAVTETWVNSLLTKYNPFHHLCQIWESSIYLTQNQIY